MKYFKKEFKDKEELKKEFRRMCKIMHPDKGGNADNFKAMFAEYKKCLDNFDNIFNGEAEVDLATFEKANYFKNILKGFTAKIEISGSWLWFKVDYNKRAIAILKTNNCRWSKSKKLWYWFSGIEANKKRKGKLSTLKRREKYGSKIIETEKIKAIG